ncbi:MAG: hypothetical protein GY856_21095 [bacterium]|nr:hypothetical protein [bacterium]
MVAWPAPSRWLTVVVVGVMYASPAPGQQFGQWWWEALITGSHHDARRLIDGDEISDTRQTELKLGLDLNGFIIHPNVTTFRVGLDTIFSRIDDERSLDTDRLGLRTDFALFPRGSYPVRFFFHRENADYSTDREPSSPLSQLGLLDTATSWGANARLRTGKLRGTLVGFEHSTLKFLDPEANREIHDNQFVDWSRRGSRLKHHARLERNYRTFGTIDMELDDLTLTFDEHGQLAPTWRWELSGSGVMRDLTVGERPSTETDFYRVRNRLAHPMRDADLLDLRSTATIARAGSGYSADSYGLTVYYRWRPRPGWEVAPFSQYQNQSVNEVSVHSPRAGVSASWSRQGSVLDLLLSTTASYGVLRRDGSQSAADEDESNLAFAFSGSLGHGVAKRLRKELEVELGRNEIRLTRDPVFDLPDLGLPRSAVGTEDSYRARIRLRRTWQSWSASLWSEVSVRESAGSLRLSDFESETLSTNLYLGIRRFTLQATSGETSVVQEDPGDQEINFFSASASWRPWHSLSMRAVYRSDTSRIALIGDIDGERIEAQLRLKLGLLDLSVRVFERTQRVEGDRELASKGLTLSITRRLAGLLPIITGTERRGEIF